MKRLLVSQMLESLFQPYNIWSKTAPETSAMYIIAEVKVIDESNPLLLPSEIQARTMVILSTSLLSMNHTLI